MGPEFWLGNVDSNHDRLIQSQVSCRWTIPQQIKTAFLLTEA